MTGTAIILFDGQILAVVENVPVSTPSDTVLRAYSEKYSVVFDRLTLAWASRVIPFTELENGARTA